MLVGHVDSKTAPAVFHRLRQLRPGDEILVGRADGTTSRFLVGRLEQHPKTALPSNRIWTRAKRPPAASDHLRRQLRQGHRPLPRQLIVYASPTGS